MTLRHERGVTESFFIKPTTAVAVREATPPGPEDDANVDRAERVFAATDEEEREMLRLAREASETIAAAGRGGGEQN